MFLSFELCLLVSGDCFLVSHNDIVCDLQA